MKKTICILLACGLGLGSCTLKPEKGNVENVIQQGLWKVSQFINSSVDETSDFNGYRFNFHVNHYLVATGASQTITGNWEVIDDNGAIKLNMHFNDENNTEFSQLEEDWQVTELSTTQIKTSTNGGEKFLDMERL